MKKKEDGIWIKEKTLKRTDLSMTDKVILAKLSQLQPNCNPSNRYLADLIGVKPANISRIITKLTRLGYIECIFRKTVIDDVICTKRDIKLLK